MSSTPPPAYERPMTPPPSYSCTVFKQGYVNWKKESMEGVSVQSSWNTVFFHLHGTLLEVYTKGASLIDSLSMLKSHVGIATDYTRHSVLRVRFGTKDQYLIKPINGKLSELVSWFEHLQSSANISSDIDKRRMPRILTLSRGQRQTRFITLTIGKTQAILPVFNVRPTF